jgi:hypothetical protein
MTLGGVMGFGLPLLLFIFGLPWLIIAMPAIMLSVAFGPLALLRMIEKHDKAFGARGTAGRQT